MWVLLVFFACIPPSEPKDSEPPLRDSPAPEDSSPVTDSDPETLPPSDCVEDAALFSEITVENTDIATVLRVSWTTTEATEGFIVFSDGVLSHSTPLSAASTEHSQLLLGVPADTDVSFQIMAGDRCSAINTARTESLPAGLPPLSVVTLDAARVAGGYTIVPLITESTSFITIIDALGRYVWAYEFAYAGVYRARIAPDYQSILFNNEANTVSGEGAVWRINLDGSGLISYAIPGGHTDFIALEDGTLTVIGWDVQERDGRTFVGDTIVRRNPDGSIETLWNAFDHLDVDTSVPYSTGWYPADPAAEDWSHVNNLSYAEGDYFFSVANLNAVVRIDGETGAQEWIMRDDPLFGNPYPDEDIYFYNLHSVQYLGDNHILVFNRQDYVDRCSSADEYEVDPTTNTFTRVWSHSAEECYKVYYLGEAQRLDNSNTRISWTTSGVIDEVDTTGAIVSSYALSLGAGFAFISPTSSLYGL